MKKLRIYAVGCTHQFHDNLIIPENVDIMLHTGDATNVKSPIMNVEEMKNFLEWYSSLDIKYKVFVAGNHDTSIEAGLIKKNYIESFGIIYLQDTSVNIEGLNIYGTPWTPRFSDWAFMKDRSKMERVWDAVPIDTDILVTHGPAKGFLDTSRNRDGSMEFCGCANLAKKLINKQLSPSLMVHSHIHDCKGIVNFGIRSFNETVLANVSSVLDGHFTKGLIHNGILFESEDKKITKVNM